MTDVAASVYIAIVVAVSSMFGPVVVAWITNRYRHQEKQEEYARQDEVAHRLEIANRVAEESRTEVAQKLDAVTQSAVEGRSEVARRLDEITQTTTEGREAISGRLEQIHGLVNSNLSAALQSEFDAITIQLALMEEVVSLRQKGPGGHGPSPETMNAIAIIRNKLIALGAVLKDRKVQTAVSDEAAANPPPVRI